MVSVSPVTNFFFFELPVEHLCNAMERFGGLGDRRRIWLAALEHDRFDHVFENEYRAGRIPMPEIPELPARHIEPRLLVGWKQAALRPLGREVLQNGVR